MKKLMSLVFAAALMGVSVAAHATRIAVVDVKKVFDAYSGTQSAKDALKKKVDDERSKMEKEKDELDKEFTELQGKKSVLTDDKFKEETEALQVKGHALQDKYQSVTDELQKEEAKQTSEIVDLIKEAAAKVAKDNKYDMVFEASNVLYGGEEITAKVIEEVNAK